MPSFGTEPRRKYLVAAKTCKTGMYECVVYRDHCTCTCHCYKFNNLCKHSLCVLEMEGILQDHVNFLMKSPRCTKPSKSGLVEPCSKDAAGKKGGSHNNRWRMTRDVSGQKNGTHPFKEIHHNNIPLVVCFLNDNQKAKECRQCRMEFPRRLPIVPYDITFSHKERWMYPSAEDHSRKLSSAQFTTKYYCVKRSCITTRFPYFDSSFIEIPPSALERLRPSHFNLMEVELDYKNT